MQRYAIIGSPIAHSLSPAMQQAAFDTLGVQASYEAIEATSAKPIFSQLRAAQYNGWNVTTPLKEEAVACVDRLTDAASRANAVNVVRAENGELVGHNTDGAGFLAAVAELWSWEVRNGSALILGSGPAARAVALELIAANIGSVYCWSRNRMKALAIGPLPERPVDLVVCALPANARVPREVIEVATPARMVFDLNYRASRSPAANIASMHRSDGLPLLLHQGALSFVWWTGQAAPVEVMRAALAAPPLGAR